MKLNATTEKTFSIVFSNYTAQIFAWSGDARTQKPFLGNRVVLGEVKAHSALDAMTQWIACSKSSPTESAKARK